MLFVCIAIYSFLQKFVKIVKKKKKKKKKNCKKKKKSNYNNNNKNLFPVLLPLVHASQKQAYLILTPLNPTFIQ